MSVDLSGAHGAPVVLSILLIEDDAHDAVLVAAHLESDALTCRLKRVATESELRAELEGEGYDVVLADGRLPGFSGLQALKIVRQFRPDLPFILVSGSISDEVASEMLHMGATDFVSKNRLSLLLPSLRRAIQEAQDRAQRRRAEEARAVAEEQYRSIVENSVEGIFRATLDDRYLMVNPALARMLGYESAEELMACVTDLNTHFREPAELERAKRLLAESGVLHGFQFEMRRRNGEPLMVSSTVWAVRNTQGEVAYVEGMVEDIGERLRLERELRQAQKMEAVGQLAGGVAHDFNNILTAIIGYSDFLREGVSGTPRLLSMVAEIHKAAGRAATLTRQLLAFSRKQVLQPKVFPLSTIVHDMEKMLSRLIGEDIEVVVRCDARTERVNADPGQVEQVLMNLVVNARDAMPDGGLLSIETSTVQLDLTASAELQPLVPGPYIRLTVSDTGCGMDDTTRARAFEPFFTTKGPGKGTGLGLSTVYGIVKQSGGHITITTAPGQGTRFDIYLPRVPDSGEQQAEDDGPASRPVGQSETVLLVEDDRVVQGLARHILEANGYHVLPADDAESAFKTSQGHVGEIHLLLTDVVMPGANGRDLAESLQRARPTMRVLFMSGYNDNVVARHGVLDRGVMFLPKPFSTEHLLQKVREALDTAAAPVPSPGERHD